MTMATYEAYCVKCREKREMKDPNQVEMKNGRPAMEGTCPVCGTKLFRMLSAKDAAGTASNDDASKKEKSQKAEV